MDLPRYKYEPLNSPDEIRVLELNATKTRIEIRILHVSVSGRSFQALSYVWRKPEQPSEVIILDQFGRAAGWIPLTRNLRNAMHNLRDAKRLDGKVLWIDRICISQGNEKEKNHQAAMMSQIYTQASLERIRDQITDGSIQLERLSLALDLDTIPRARLGVAGQLLNKEIITLRGHRLMDWDAITSIPFLFAARHLPQQYRDTGQKQMDDNLPHCDEVEEILCGIWWDRRARLEPGSGYTWSSLLCADARDRVYAILAIPQDPEGLGLNPD
ncbi:heterokaryon incompatibility protein-domain-containing protein [Aspergillus spectabilis]